MRFLEDDQPLAEFLRQHRSPVPPAPVDLEDQILNQITVANSPAKLARRRHQPAYWAIPTAIAAGLVATLIGFQALTPKPPSQADEAKLEAFIETNWNSVVNSDPTDYELLFTDTASSTQ